MINVPVRHTEHFGELRIREYDLDAVPAQQRSIDGLTSEHRVNYSPDTRRITDYAVDQVTMVAVRLDRGSPDVIELEMTYHSLLVPQRVLSVISGIQPPSEEGWESVVYGDEVFFKSLTPEYLDDEAERLAGSGFERVNGFDVSIVAYRGISTGRLPELGNMHELAAVYNAGEPETMQAVETMMQQTVHPSLAPHVSFILSRETEI